jgi:protease-4
LQLDLPHYYVATAANRIVVPPGTDFELLGLYSEAIFLREFLERLGIEPQILQISPYKTAGNQLDKADMTAEQREQLNWLLDDNFDMITADIAADRNLSQDEVKRFIDEAPFSAEEAVQRDLIDDVAYEDELSLLLASEASGSVMPPAEETDVDGAELLPWAQARPLLFEKVRHRTRKSIGLVSLEGAIAMGSSRQPPVDIPIPFIGGAMAGARTVTHTLRQVEKDDRLAAIVIYVDSPGGSAQASDLIWREVKRLAQRMPVVAYMGNVAASGGYLASVAARHIVSQPGTLTGSIGVIMGKFNTEAVYEKLGIKRRTLQRGAHAGLYRGEGPLSSEEYDVLWRHLVRTYDDFKRAVADGRPLAYEDLDDVASGKVWTGRQAKERGLVDSHGDLLDAIVQAAQLAGMSTTDPFEISVIDYHASSSSHIIPRPYEPVQEVIDLLIGEQIRAMSGQPLLLLPFQLSFF